MHILTTAAHITLIFVYTALSILGDNVKHFDGGAGNGYEVPSIRVLTAWVIIAGLQDIFMAFMMFFILDQEVDVICDESRHISYAVLEVIKLDGVHGSD